MEISDQLIPSQMYDKGRFGRKPDAIVLHTMVGSLEGTKAWFSNVKRSPKSSAHYGIALDGRVWRFVREEDTAWHAGNVYKATAPLVLERKGINPNWYTIGIEHEDNGDPEAERTEAMYEASAKLVYDICKRWNIPIDRKHIIIHREITQRKSCPGILNAERIVERAKRIGMNENQSTLQWAVNLESFFLERQIPPERRESIVRSWADTVKTFDGHVSKWIREFNLPEGSGLVQVDAEIAKLMGIEDDYVSLRDAAQSVAGQFDDDSALIKALEASGGDLRKCVTRRDVLEDENKRLRAKRNVDKYTSRELVKEVFIRLFRSITGSIKREVNDNAK